MSAVCDVCDRYIEGLRYKTSTNILNFKSIIYLKNCDVCGNRIEMCSECYRSNERHYVCLSCIRNEKIGKIINE